MNYLKKYTSYYVPYFICLGTMKLSTHNFNSFVHLLKTLILARSCGICSETIVNKVEILLSPCKKFNV